MAKLSRDLASTTLHPREDIFATGVLGALNAEVIINSDGCSTVALDLRGTFNMTVEVAGTVDGVNWTLIPVRMLNGATKIYLAAVTGTTPGIWYGAVLGFRQVRARVTAWTSGSAVAFLNASTSSAGGVLEPMTNNIGTTIGTAGTATTLTLASPGTGLRHYLTYLSINRFATAALTAAAAPVAITTTNLPGSLAFSFPAEAALQGTLDRWREDFAFPIMASAPGTATTIVCPATTGVIWRITAGFYVAP